MFSNTNAVQSSFSTIRLPKSNGVLCVQTTNQYSQAFRPFDLTNQLFWYGFKHKSNTVKLFYHLTSRKHSTSKRLSSVLVRYQLIKSSSSGEAGGRGRSPKDPPLPCGFRRVWDLWLGVYLTFLLYFSQTHNAPLRWPLRFPTVSHTAGGA